MTDRYDFAILQKQIIFSNWKNCLSSLYFILFIVSFIYKCLSIFFSFDTEFCKHIQFKKKKKKMENLGIDSITSRMQSGRSTIWANPPARKIRVISWMIWEFSLCQHTFCLPWGPYSRVDAFIFSEFARVVILCLCCSWQVKYPR